MKKYLGIIMLSLAVGLSAFTHAPKTSSSKETTTYWFKFIGTNASDPQQRNDPSMYQKQNGGVRTCFSTGNLCEVQAEESASDSSQPNLSTEDDESYLP